MHAYGIQKNGANEPTCRAGIEMQTWGVDLWTQCTGARVGRVALAYTPPCVRQTARRKLLWSSALCAGLRGGWGVGGRLEAGIHVYTELIHVVYTRNQHNTGKQVYSKFKKVF